MYLNEVVCCFISIFFIKMHFFLFEWNARRAPGSVPHIRPIRGAEREIECERESESEREREREKRERETKHLEQVHV